MSVKALFAALMLLCCGALHAAAPAHIEQNLPQARLAGKGAFTYFTLKIYDAELWVGQEVLKVRCDRFSLSAIPDRT